MKILRYILFGIGGLVIVSVTALFVYLQNQKPTLNGTIELQGLQENVEVLFDDYGVPHIYANNASDAYFALGYVHAQDRLFQMEMLRRVASGRLCEILGPDQIAVDKLFRTLGLQEFAKRSAIEFEQDASEECNAAVHAYLDGINQFVKQGKTPIEFTIIGIPKAEFSVEDVYLAGGFMSFGFAEGLRADPILQKIKDQYGSEYLEPLLSNSPLKAQRIQNHFPVEANNKLIATIDKALNDIPIPLWHGSNGWVVSAQKSTSGSPILANDTHIGFGQPAVWYEAHLEYPGFSFYGHHVAGVPFGLLGNNDRVGWGLTMFENDDVDFYIEELNPDNPNQVRFKDGWEDLTTRNEIIKVKDSADVPLTVKSSRHGPIMNGIIKDIPEDTSPISVSWMLTKVKNPLLQGFYDINHAASLEDMQKAVSTFTAPGLNVMYGDIDGNIAWWAIAKLPIRADHVNTKLFHNGSSGEDEYLGYYEFNKNPQAINPPWGYVYSTNNQPDSVYGIFYPGYYYPKARAKRIDDFLKQDRKWSLEDMKEINLDVVSLTAPAIAQEMASVLKSVKGESFSSIVATLEQWDGDHSMHQVAPTIYYTLLANILFDAMEDELGFDALNSLINTSIMKSNYLAILSADQSPWWDNVNTNDIETRSQIVESAANKTLATLSKEYGDDINQWAWGKAHTITHKHPLGAVKLLSRFFDVGPFEVPGGIEVLNNLMFPLDTTGHFKVYSGPALRKVTDFADIKTGQTVSPSGQSGNVMSDHYDDQAEMYVTGKTRKMLMNRSDIESVSSNRLLLVPVVND